MIATGSLVLASSSWAGHVFGARFDEALGATQPGIVVQARKADPHAEIRRSHGALATDTHDAVVRALTIDDHLLAEGLIHNSIEGPIGPDDPSVTGEIRPRRRIAATPAAASAAATPVQQAALKPATAAEPASAGDGEEPLLITDRVADAEALQPSDGWVDRCKSAFSRLFKRTP